jgi:FkbM family methyltransferase
MRYGKAIATDAPTSRPLQRDHTQRPASVASGGAPAEAWGTYRPQGVAGVAIQLTRNRIVRGAARRFVGNYLKDAQPFFDVEIDGMKMRCAARDNPTEWGLVFMGARQDHVGRDVIIAPLRKGDVFLDVGANCGAYALFAARAVGPSGRVIAVEPMPEMLRRLRYNIAVNGFRNIEVVPTAVGPEAGTATLYVDEARRGLSSMEALEGATPLQVPIATLLSVVERAGVDRIDALKIDIEGFEDRALLPFISTAPRTLWPRRIYMETDWAARWERDCIAGLIAAGYAEAWRSRGDILLRLPEAA